MDIENILEEEFSDEDSQQNLFGDDTDEDPDYRPRIESSDSEQLDENGQETVQEALVWKQSTKHPGRKRTRRIDNWAKNRAKIARNEGREYVDRKGKVHQGKHIREYNHTCRYKCNINIVEAKRQDIFDSYWNLGSWDLQTAFLCSCLTLSDPVRKKEGEGNKKDVSCTYTLEENRVCKMFFLKTLDITNKRITNIIKMKRSSTNLVPAKDKRGRKSPTNKMPAEKVNLIMEHVRSLPRYSSHYSRNKAPNIKYLNPNLTLKLMYTMYVDMCSETNTQPVKESFYRHIFHTKFNLSFHRPLTDTCDKCDILQNVIKNSTDDEAVHQAKIEHEVHLRKAEAATTAKVNDAKMAEADTTRVCVCFDLQKTLPTPSLTCKKVYYSRQLWTYNFCVHNLGNGQGNMFIWHEGQGSRGSKEMASCLLKFINTLPKTVKHLTVYSDNCSGQNKSHFIVKFWHYVVINTHIETIDHKFLVVGHSYMECDQDFGLIEKSKKKNHRDIYLPEQWAALIANSSRKFLVNQMQDNDFKTLDTLSEFFRKSVPGISKMQWLHFEKNDPYILFYKESLNMETYLQMNMRSSKKGRTPLQIPALVPTNEKAKIKLCKYKDLQDLLPYIPPIHHDFYTQLSYGGNEEGDNIRGSDEVIMDNMYDTDDENV